MLGARSGDLLGRRRTFLLGIGLFSVSSLVGGFCRGRVDAARLPGPPGCGRGHGRPVVAGTPDERLRRGSPSGCGRSGCSPRCPLRRRRRGARGRGRAHRARVVAVGDVRQRAHRSRRLRRGTGRAERDGAAPRSFRPRRRRDLGARHDRDRPRPGRSGHDGMGRSLPWARSLGGAALLGIFVHIESRADEPILPAAACWREQPHGRRPNVSRGLVYAGMYGMFFFLGQFLQDVQGYSPLRAGLSFLPVPASVFLSSQLASKVLINRMRPKTLMLGGIATVIVSLVLSSRLHAGASYAEVLLTLVLLGVGSGTSLVTLTSASLAGVEPQDARRRLGAGQRDPAGRCGPRVGGARHGVRRCRRARTARFWFLDGGTRRTRLARARSRCGLSASVRSSPSSRWSWWPSWCGCRHRPSSSSRERVPSWWTAREWRGTRSHDPTTGFGDLTHAVGARRVRPGDAHRPRHRAGAAPTTWDRSALTVDRSPAPGAGRRSGLWQPPGGGRSLPGMLLEFTGATPAATLGPRTP